MSSDESSTEFQECILKCPDAKVFFNFPNKVMMRNVWYYKLGLDEADFYPYKSVCDRHFSKKMFTSEGKLRAIAVPDINLPNDPTSKKIPTGSVSAIAVSGTPTIKTIPNTSLKKQKPIKSVEFPSVQSAIAPLNSTPPTAATNPNTNAQTDGNPLATDKWINDNSEILVDYQLKVNGKHLCDVIEIPQYVVVFTVIKAKQNKTIKLSDLKNNNSNNNKNKKKAVTTKKPALKNIPKPSVFITIDDDTGDAPEISSEPVIAQTKSLEIVPLEVSVGQTKLQEIAPAVLPNEPPKKLPTLKDKPQKIVEPDLADLQADLLEILEPENSEDVSQNSSPTTLQSKPKRKPEIDVVFFTTDDVPPRRDRSTQVDFSRKSVTTAIQCDFQFDNDPSDFSHKSQNNNNRMQTINPPAEDTIDECHLCGEILNDYASKVKHARGHESSPSLCSQCGDVLESKIDLEFHERTYHSSSLYSGKPQRCPKTKCNKAFRSLKQLNQHIEEHVRTRQHKCNKCFETFNSAMKLICHQRALDKCLRTRGWTSRRWSKRI